MNDNSPCREYLMIINWLEEGNKRDWDKIASLVPSFPKGVDGYIGRRWITNAIDCGSANTVRWMLSKEIDLMFVDEEGYSVLHSCIDRTLPNKYIIMQLLIDHGAAINVGTTVELMGVNGWSPLHMAAVRNDLKAITLLLKNGADRTLVTCVDDYCNAEDEATRFGNKDAAALIRNFKRK